KDQAKANLLKIVSVLVLVIVFGRWVHPMAGISHTTATRAESSYVLAGQSTTPATPVATASADQNEQSSGFRFLLWKGAAKLIKSNPIGYGIGTYRYESARPGYTTETQLAHNTFLQ